MSAQPARHLHLVDGVFHDDNGEVVTEEVAKLLDQIEKLTMDLKMAQRDVKAKNRRIATLEADAVRERLDYSRRVEVERVFKYWQRRCGHEKAALTPLRFDAIRGILEQQLIEVDEGGKKRRRLAYRIEDFKTAIDGCALDHYVKERKNGSVQHFDDIEWVCRDGKNFEECLARAPVAQTAESA